MGLDTVELIMLVEDQFQIEIPDNHAENLTTVQQLVDYTFEKIKTQHQENSITKDQTAFKVCSIIKEITGIPIDKIKMEHAFTSDLGMD